ncbi:CDGSH-type Zn-finger protein [Aequitasia blattaphilus]|uniref:CDGSH iron-sulfur domain-containing protein n=1 Tax=Aequitasia blattaphilus TaxID=2949332 RepID=A0ABT1EB87_9FIRM|nr:CDGSH iron-sulfur domain-containing protein [Aequitasia blattaphilus]MCP1103099.1 CDGSH iron-sulfur domain-containing protein [Aequitasia blattaphilus]MCR8615739.1 CDGSH iron-sulfur domain-containing protein [Aequitasia blattaphilus]
MKIKITENGPYIVTGNIPIKEMIITPVGKHYEFREGRKLPQSEEYALCRCGKSKNAPFCDGNHEKSFFRGDETALKEKYIKRIEDAVEGDEITLLDDGRCCFARFCHTEEGDIWSVTESDGIENHKEMAIKAAKECPAGRLVMIDKEGNILEETSEPEIIIMQDPQKNSSSAIFVKGPIQIEGADGTLYEVRNRVALCRCGKSKNKPFCDATHAMIEFNDGHL